MQKSQGQHASFWSQPIGGNGPGSDGHEIDIIEYFGDKHPQGGLTSFIHWYKGKRLIKTGSWIKDSKSFLKNKQGRLVEELPRLLGPVDAQDDHLPHRRQGDLAHVGPRLEGPQYLILSLLASDYEALEMSDKKLPQHMYVDWVRVWETPQP